MKLGLVLEGGGMKCAYTAAILDRMLDDGVRPDYVIGVSAGAACGISFAAGQRDRNRRFFVDYVTDPDYIGFSAWKSSGSIFNLHYIYQECSTEGGKDPVDLAALNKNPMEWWAVATDIETGKPHYFTKKDVRPDDCRALMASSSIPVVCRPVEIDGHRYCDGGCSKSIPVKRALEAGCDRVIIILCRPKDTVRQPEAMKPLYKAALRKYPNLVRSIELRHVRYNRQLRAARKLERQGHACILAPRQQLEISTYTKDPDKLQRLYDIGIEDYNARRDEILRFAGMR